MEFCCCESLQKPFQLIKIRANSCAYTVWHPLVLGDYGSASGEATNLDRLDIGEAGCAQYSLHSADSV